MDIQILALLFALVLIAIVVFRNKGSDAENFNIAVSSSSAWDWNTGMGYGAGYGTGYGLYGAWPGEMPEGRPWEYWMWERRPSIFSTPYTPMPQVDYNDAPDNDSREVSNFNVSILPTCRGTKIAINGFPGKTLQLDRGRNYYFHVYSPGAPFVITDGKNNLFAPIENDTITLNFSNTPTNKLYYYIAGKPETGGIIYLNSIRGDVSLFG